jgi:apolipoprotein N-acyltransferase
MVTLLSIPFLLAGGGLRLFDFGRRTIPLAVWLAPVFLLVFSRLNEPIIAIPAVGIVIFLAALVAYRGVIPVPGFMYPAIIAVYAIIWTLPFLSDRLLYAHLPGFTSTLIFPLTWVLVELLSARFHPYGSWGSLAYTQYGNQPLMQLASITGLSGITFLVAWFGSTISWAWGQGFDWTVLRSGLLIYAVVWSLVMLYGGIRLAFTKYQKTVRTASIGWPESIMNMDQMMGLFTSSLVAGQVSEEQRAKIHQLQHYFLDATRREAHAGSKIIVWPEINLLILQEEEAAFIDQTRRSAQEQRIYILMGMGVLRPGESKPLVNKSVLIDPRGEVAFSYLKSRPVPGPESMYQERGDGLIPTYDSEYGRLASPICFDMDFPSFIRQVGQSEADILLVPASDWASIKRLHHVMAVFRAVENGTSMLRAARWGTSSAVDPLGRSLGILDDIVSPQQVMVAHVPTQGTRTLYARIGDLFAWICAVSLVGTIVWAMIY